MYNRGLSAGEVSTLYSGGNGSDLAAFAYDGDGARVAKHEAGAVTLYPNRYQEKNATANEVTTYYYLGGQMVALRKGSTLEYVHQDHLTGTSVTTDTSSATKSTVKYLPYGSTRSSTGSLGTDKKYTGQRLDGTGLYFYNARYYDPGIGRFVSADSVVPGLHMPQGLNRYAYVLNNPLRYTDPTGFRPTAGEIAAADDILSNPGPCFGGECIAAVTWAAGIRRQADAVNSVQAIVGQTPVLKPEFAGKDLTKAPEGGSYYTREGLIAVTDATYKATITLLEAGVDPWDPELKWSKWQRENVMGPLGENFKGVDPKTPEGRSRILAAIVTSGLFGGGGRAPNWTPQVRQDQRAFLASVWANYSATRKGAPLSYSEADEVVRRAWALELEVDFSHLYRQEGRDWGTHFKIGRLHVPVQPGYQPPQPVGP